MENKDLGIIVSSDHGPFKPYVPYLGRPSTNKIPMNFTIPHVFDNHRKYCRYMNKTILQSSQKVTAELEACNDEEIEYNAFSTEEWTRISRLVEDLPICFFVLGQNAFAKTCVVNELFSQIIMPHIIEAGDRSCMDDICLNYEGVFIKQQTLFPYSSDFGTITYITTGRPRISVRADDLMFGKGATKDPDQRYTRLEIQVRKSVIEDNYTIIVTSDNFFTEMNEFIEKHLERTIPIVIYGISEEKLSNHQVEELKQMIKLLPNVPIFFVRSLPVPPPQLQANIRVWHQPRENNFNTFPNKIEDKRKIYTSIYQTLCEIGYLSNNSPDDESELSLLSEYVDKLQYFGTIHLFMQTFLESRIINAASKLYTGCHQFIKRQLKHSTDLTRNMININAKLDYVKKKEVELVDALKDIARHSQDEFNDLIIRTVASVKDEVMTKIASHQFTSIQIPDNETVKTSRELKICTNEIVALILEDLNAAIEQNLIDSFNCLKEGFVGTLERTLKILEKDFKTDAEKFQTSGALALVLNSVSQIEFLTKFKLKSKKKFWGKMSEVVENMHWNRLPKVDAEWKQKIAAGVIARINERRLAIDIGLQILEIVNESHNLFTEAFAELSVYYTERLERDKAHEHKIRKCIVPDLSDVVLRSAAVRDGLLYGIPEVGRKIGTGRFGVVYNCAKWFAHENCAVKTVIPPNVKLWKMLAAELYYARALPRHFNIVNVWGVLIDHSHTRGISPAVCIVMDRFETDLHMGLDKGLSWLRRLQIAIDVVEGLCFLHDQRLIHRNIKLTNILLDIDQRAKISDIGCCTEETFTILPVPVHVAPELFCGYFDYATDVYAFGILFWYICAGRVRVPTAYRYCYTKQFLCALVKDGHRPERYPHFNDPCWEIMEKCWAGIPSSRPFIIEVKHQLQEIKHQELVLKRRSYYQRLSIKH